MCRAPLLTQPLAGAECWGLTCLGEGDGPRMRCRSEAAMSRLQWNNRRPQYWIRLNPEAPANALQGEVTSAASGIEEELESMGVSFEPSRRARGGGRGRQPELWGPRHAGQQRLRRDDANPAHPEICRRVPGLFFRVTRGLQKAMPLVIGGRMSVQDESAGLVALMADPQPGDVILDACAAPGGELPLALPWSGPPPDSS